MTPEESEDLDQGALRALRKRGARWVFPTNHAMAFGPCESTISSVLTRWSSRRHGGALEKPFTIFG